MPSNHTILNGIFSEIVPKLLYNIQSVCLHTFNFGNLHHLSRRLLAIIQEKQTKLARPNANTVPDINVRILKNSLILLGINI